MRFPVAAISPEERIRRYRQMAAEAFQLAASTHDVAVKAGHLSLASGWQVLALEIEHSHGLAVRPGRDDANGDQPTSPGKT